VLFGLGVLGAVAFSLHRQLKYFRKVAKALATDERLPRPLRWAFTVALAIKMVPVPDFGVDQVILVVVGVLLVTVYRPTLRAILHEVRSNPSRVSGRTGHPGFALGTRR
jgi:hypothetical protein